MEKNMLEIIKRAQNGDEIAFQAIYDRYYKQAFYYALKICRNSEADANDATQEAFMTIHSHLPQLLYPEYFVAWMSKIVFSKCTKIFRSRKDTYLEDGDLIRMNAKETKRDYIPIAFMREQTDKEIVQRMISELSPLLAQSLQLIYFEQLSYKEVSDQLKIPVGTVKSRVNQGREQLKSKVISFEAKEGRKIDFKLDGLLPTGLLLCVLTKGRHLLTTSAMQGALIVAATSVITIGGYSLYQTAQANKPVEPKTSEIVQNDNATSPFKSVTYKGKEVLTAKNAYFILMNWAANEQELQKYKDENLTEVTRVVNAILESDSVYRNMLENQGWFDVFLNIQ